jgi:hypothetical protein
MKELLLILFSVISLLIYFLTFKIIFTLQLSWKKMFLLVYLTLVIPIVDYLLVSKHYK